MHPDKAPRPDGLNQEFYQHYWDILGDDIAPFGQQVFSTGVIPGEVNHTNLILIPKKEKPESLGDMIYIYCPVQCCLSFFSKVLADRMKVFLKGLIYKKLEYFCPGQVNHG
ncbi:unnamed protein product [Cuscuta europaea]|uniref:Uncharacterized protein n=1 Tax=Cuscuta europaea TaxID=41803 RepID=A0A9P0ZL91_CUSEU|nr:unnamed protein product [Cuscuta europaea]